MTLRRYLHRLQTSGTPVTLFFNNSVLSPGSITGQILQVHSAWLRVESVLMRNSDNETQLIPWHASIRIKVDSHGQP